MRTTFIFNGVRPGSPGWSAPWVPHHRMRDRLSTASREACAALYWEMAVVARIDSIAMLIRGVQDHVHGDIATLRTVVEGMRLLPGMTGPAWELFFDTGSWHHAAGDGKVFDFANPQHWQRCWDRVIYPGASAIHERWYTPPPANPFRWERLEDDRVPVTFWSIYSAVGFAGQEHASPFLDWVAGQLRANFEIEAAFNVDESWHRFDPNGPYWAVNNWFDPTVSGHTVRTHNGVTAGVCVPGFIDPPGSTMRRELSRNDGQRLWVGLAACREARCHKVLLEGFTDWEESAPYWDAEAWGLRELETVREHIQMAKTPGHPILDADLTDDRVAYRLLVPENPTFIATIVEFWTSTRGGPPNAHDLAHVHWRAFREALRWRTLRGALEG